MKIVLVTLGTSGDVNPFLSIARALRHQGHETIFVTQPYFQDQIEQEGFRFCGCGQSWDPTQLHHDTRLTKPGSGTFLIWKEIYLPFVSAAYHCVRSVLQQEQVSVVLNHIWCFGGFLAAREKNIRHGMVALAPLVWFSQQDPSIYGPLIPPAWLHRFLITPAKAGLNWTLGRDLRKLSRTLGLSELGNQPYFAAMQHATYNLGMWSPSWRGISKDDPPHSFVCGFPGPGTHENAETTAPSLPKEVEQFLAAGSAPVVLGLGSALPQGALDVYEAVGQACLNLGHRAILVGVRPEQFPTWPDSLLKIPFASYRALFPRAAVTIHHAGIGTLAEALRAGRPSLVIPFANDQFDNARRSVMIGQALSLPRYQVNVDNITRMLQSLMANPAMFRCAQQLGQQLQQEHDGAVTAASIITRS